MAIEEVAQPVESAVPRPRVSGVVARLTAANVLGAASGFVTGPLQARALGASGRGDLAAVVVPLSLAPWLLSFGITAFAYRAFPRGRSREEVLGSLGLPLVVIGLVVAACAIPAADALAGGRVVVRTFLIVGLASTPLVLLNMLLSSSLASLERWRAVLAMNVIPFAVPFVATVTLFALHRLTVGTAAASTIAGSLLAVIPGMAMLRGAGRPVVRMPLTRAAVGFGFKSWLGGFAQLANARLDQFLMITAVPPRQLGMYAVATTISGVSGLATGALSPPLMARIGSGHSYLIPQAVRITLTATIATNCVVALLTPLLLSVLFGPQFHDALPMVLLLLVASIPFAGASVLSTSLQADGAPLIPTMAEATALVITVVGLAVLLGPLQGQGAAIVSIAAYGASFVFQLAMAARRLALPVRQFVVPSRADLVWARDLVRRAAAG
jgi:O-antigen/teichoic acid export membrane protein